MDSETPLRAGIVGCGYQGGILAQTIVSDNVSHIAGAWRVADAWRVAACADPSPVRSAASENRPACLC